MIQGRSRLIPAAVLAVVASSGCSDFATAPTRTPSEVRVTPDTVLLLTGESAEFQVELLDENGEVYEVVPAWAPPLWTSKRPSRVQIDGNSVTALLGGETVLEVELAGVVAEAVLRGNPLELGVSTAMAYITQSVQRTQGGVPLVAGRDGLLRVAVLGDDENFYRPTVQATFLNGGSVVHTAIMALENDGLPLTLAEGVLQMTYDAPVPGSVLQPGVRLALEIDAGGVPARAGSELRIPASGSVDLGVREVRPFRLMMVPVTLAADGNRQSRLTPEYADGVTRLTRDIFPLGAIDIEVREPYVTNARMSTEDGWYQLIEEIAVLRHDDGNPHYYYGGFDRPSGTFIAGLGYLGYPVSIGMDNAQDVIAHEIGHNFNLPHAPCGEPAHPDPRYPYAGGVVGVYGYNRSSGTVQPRDRYDLMSYCDPIWISDYNYERVVAYRDTSVYDAAFEGSALRAPETETLLIRGGVFQGRLRLEPAMEWTGRVVMPRGGGRYTLEGLDQAGGVLFSLAVEPRALDHGGSQFLIAMPLEMARTDQLARLRLSGPEGAVERGRSAAQRAGPPEVRMARVRGAAGAPAGLSARWDAGAYPLAVVRDRDTGRIRAMSRTGSIALPDEDPSRFEVVVSDGVRSRPATVVQR